METRLARIVAAKPLPGFKVWCKFDDGKAGVADFSEWTARPYYDKWLSTEGFFESVVIDGSALRWDEDADAGAEVVRRMVFGDAPMGPAMDYPALVEAVPGEGFTIECAFADGTHGMVDLTDWAANDKFAKWLDRSYFERAKCVGWGVQWETCVDIAADWLYENCLRYESIAAA